MRLEDIDEYTELYTKFCKCGHKSNRHMNAGIKEYITNHEHRTPTFIATLPVANRKITKGLRDSDTCVVPAHSTHCYECTCQSMALDKKEWEERNDRNYPEPKEYKENCDRCDGTGEIHPRLCDRCDGTGEIENAHCHETLTCPDCNGISKEESK